MAFSRNLLLRASAEVFAKGASVVLVVAIARAVGREAFGEFSIAWAAGWLVSVASDLGLHLVALREVVHGGEPGRRVAAAALAAKAALTGVAFAGLAVAAPWLGVRDRAALWCVAGALVALSYVDLAQHLLRAQEAFRLDAAVQVAARAAFLVGGLAGLAAGGVRGAGAGMLAGALAGLAVAGVAAWRAYRGDERAGEVARAARWLLGRSIPVGVGIALSMLYVRVDLFLLEAIAGAETVGLYAGAYRVFEAAQLLPAVCLAVLFPRLAATDRKEGEGRALRRRALAGLAAAGVTVAIAGAAAAPFAVGTLYGDAFAPAAAPLAILFAAAPVMFVNYLLTQDLVSGGGGRAYATVAALALATNVTANLVAIPRYGALGAAAVTVLTEVVVLAGCAFALAGRTVRVDVGLAALALFSLPFESDRLAAGAGGLVVTVPEALVGASVLAAVAAMWRARAGPDARFALAAGCFVAALAVSTALAPEHAANAAKFTLRMAGGAAFGLALAWLVARRAGDAGVLLGAYAAGVAAASAIAVAEMVAGARLEPFLALFRDAPVYAAGLRRVTATYGYPNTAATSIAMALPVAIAVGVAARRNVARVAAWCAVAIMAVALVGTFSRGGLVATACGLGVLGLTGLRRGGARRVAAGAAVAAIAVAGAWTAAEVAGVGLAARGIGTSEADLLAARIEPSVSSLDERAGTSGRMRVRVTNAGRLPWRSTAEAPYVLVSRWYDDAGRALDGEGVRTALPPEVAPATMVDVDGAYVVPAAAGAAMLVWDVYVENRLRFSERGSEPGRVRVAIVGAAPALPSGPAVPDAAPAPAEPPALADVYNAPSRLELWRAAWAMFLDRPVTGFGPDAYRLTYGRFLGLDEWDHRVYANNLALELLATTGVLGTGAFLALLAVVAGAALRSMRSADPIALATAAALAAFLAHGLVDYFLEFTAGYVAFWALAGIAFGQASGVGRRAPGRYDSGSESDARRPTPGA